MTARAAGLALACVAAAALSGCATSPPQPDPVQVKLNDLDTRLSRIERVVDNRSLLDLSNQIEQARADLRSVHDRIDELNHELEQSRKQQRDLYADLDTRLKKLEAGAPAQGAANASAGSAAAGGAAGAAGAASADAGAAVAGDGSATTATTAAPSAAGGEQADYQAALDLLKNGRYDQAIAAFNRFLAAYPQSELADNAQYWIGETHYVNRDFAAALKAFQAVVDVYGQSRKLPDAMLKIGYCEDELQHAGKARRILAEVVAKFPGTPAAALAAERLKKLRSEAH